MYKRKTSRNKKKTIEHTKIHTKGEKDVMRKYLPLLFQPSLFFFYVSFLLFFPPPPPPFFFFFFIVLILFCTASNASLKIVSLIRS